MSAPLIVLADVADLEPAGERLAAAGTRVTRTWALPAEPWDVGAERLVCCAPIADVAAARAAVLAAARGAGIVTSVVDADLEPIVLADLARIGVVRRRARASVTLTEDERGLLRRLADGASLPEAARALLLSPRTAERRLSGARRALGVRSTAEAIVRFLDLEGMA